MDINVADICRRRVAAVEEVPDAALCVVPNILYQEKYAAL